MFRPASRAILRRSARSQLAIGAPNPTLNARRFISTAPPAQKSRSWKSSALRWGVVIGGIYYYNTSPVFAEATYEALTPDAIPEPELKPLTVEEVAAERRKRMTSSRPASPVEKATGDEKTSVEHAVQDPKSPEELEEEAGAQGAFNPETGEINWDCPCLGGMAHGPCGEEFKAAFSCFVFSEEDPKGMDCIDRFKGMQDCFRNYPEVYGSEMDEDDEDEDAQIGSEEGLSTDHGIEGGAPPSVKTSSKPLVSEAAEGVESVSKATVSAVEKKDEQKK